MKAHYNRIVRDAEKNVERSMEIQNRTESSPWYGAFSQPDGVYQAKYAIYRVSTMIAAYCNRDTKFYHDGTVCGRIHLGLDYIERVQHENGLFDYVTCNFFSPPDTAFCVLKIIPHLQYLTAQADLSPACWRAASTHLTTAGPLPPYWPSAGRCSERRT